MNGPEKPKRAVMITGCSSGIGEACALGLHKEGWQVFATARKAEDLEKLRAQGLHALYLDYRETDSIKAAADEVLAATNGKLFGLFNNGAYGLPGAIEDVPTPALREQFEANFFGLHELTRQILPSMLANGEGRIVQCSSVVGFISLAWRGAYVATKFALEGLTDTMRLELEGTGVQISLIEPGPIRTRFNHNAFDAFLRDIDYKNSRFSALYEARLADPAFEKNVNKYTLESESCLPPLRHALTAKRAKARYFVTRPTYYMAFFKRILPARWLDKILLKNSRA